MTRKRKRSRVNESSHAGNERLEPSQEFTKLTITPEATSPQYLYEEPNTPQEPRQMPWLCEEHKEILYKERLRTNSDVFTTLRDSTAQIRLLRLDVGSTENYITASLKIWDRSSLPEFNAVSYVCGKALPQKAVYINGHEFYVGNNCFYALSRVCLHYPGSYVWIDAICINQQDLEEKSAQVSAMGGIYRSALRVLACIGRSDAVSDEILRATKDPDSFIQKPPPEWDAPDAYRKACLWKPPLWNPPMDESATLKFWETFTKFELRPYFNRAWIVQELNGGHGRTTILCGQSKVDWSALCTLADRFWVISESLHAPYTLEPSRNTDHAISEFDRLATIFQDRFPQYLLIMMDKDCQDPRDRFYGTLDLVDWQRFGQKRPVPDYQITPLQLAFNLLQMTVDPGFDDVDYIARSLELHLNPNPQLLSDIDREPASQDARINARRRYGSTLVGIHKIEQKTDGRLSVDLHHSCSNLRYNRGVPDYFEGQEYNPTSLAANGLVQLFTGEKPSALATAAVHAGDFLVHGHEINLLLRHEEDRARLLVIGAALLAAKFTSHDRLEPPTGCICWQTITKARAGHSVVELRFELPDTVALESAIAKPDIRESYNSDLIFSYLCRYAVGTTMAHSGLRSPPTSHKKGRYTLRHAPTGRSLRKPCANCKRTGNPFWYILSPDEEGVVDFAN